MRSLLLIAAILWLFSHSIAQDSKEIAALRQYISVSSTVPIKISKSPALPTSPLKVYINTSDDTSASHELMQLIDEINKKNSEKYGFIEVVSDASRSNVLLIHYEVVGKRRQEMNTTLSMDPALGRGKTDYEIKTEIRGYIIAQSGDGLEILDRYARKVTVGEPRRELRDMFLKMLREQSKSQKH